MGLILFVIIHLSLHSDLSFCVLPVKSCCIAVFQDLFFNIVSHIYILKCTIEIPPQMYLFFLLCSLCFSPIPLLHFASFFISLSLIYLPFCFLFRCQLCLCPFTPPVLQGFLINSEVHITEVFI